MGYSSYTSYFMDFRQTLNLDVLFCMIDPGLHNTRAKVISKGIVLVSSLWKSKHHLLNKLTSVFMQLSSY